MTDEPALLAAVAAAPDDDTPRLVTADWLDDHGRPERAEFVRVGCRLAAASPADDDYPDLLDRRDELVAWLRTFEPPPFAYSTGPLRLAGRGYLDYRRGFPDEVNGYVSNTSRSGFRQLVNALGKHLAASPARSLWVSGLNPDQAAELVRHPVAAGLRGLTLAADDADFAPDLGGDEADPPAVPRGRSGLVVAEGFARSPHVRHLRRLWLFTELGEAAAEVLARADLPNLTELGVWPAVAEPRALAALARAKWFGNLRVLGVGEHLGEAHLEALAALPPLPHLHTLRLENNRFEWLGLRALAASRSFPNLAALDLSRNPLGDEGAGHLAKAAWSVRELRLRGCGVGNAGVRALVKGRLLDGVRILELGGNALAAQAVKALAKSAKLADVRHLDLSYARIGAEGFAALGASPHLTRLTRLEVNVFPDDDARLPVAAVAGCLERINAPRLRRLDLSGRTVGAAGAKALAARPTFANLRWLNLGEGRVGATGLAALAASPHLRELIVLDLWGNRLTDAAPLLDPATFPRLADCKLNGNAFPPDHAKALAGRSGVQVGQ